VAIFLTKINDKFSKFPRPSMLEAAIDDENEDVHLDCVYFLMWRQNLMC
jgi:hypothetical protein